MLEEVMRYINNRFDCDSRGCPYGSKTGTFTVVDGGLQVDGLLEGQYFWVEGSVLNDGLHLHPASDLKDETFDGKVVFLVVPNSVVDLAAEIEAWCAKNADVLDSPLQSESFGGYSYTKASGGSEGNEMPSAGWKVHYASRLRPYRKLAREWI